MLWQVRHYREAVVSAVHAARTTRGEVTAGQEVPADARLTRSVQRNRSDEADGWEGGFKGKPPPNQEGSLALECSL